MEQFYQNYADNIQIHISFLARRLAEQALTIVEFFAACEIVNKDEYNEIKCSESKVALLLLEVLLKKPCEMWVFQFLQVLNQMEMMDLIKVVEGLEPPAPENKNNIAEEILNDFSPVLSRSSSNASVGELTSASSSCDNSGPSNAVLSLRKYQVELAQPGMEGNSCVIIAPTGSGKTLVAVQICLEHLRQNPNAKVAFLVHMVPLVKQQHNVFRKYLEPCGFIVDQLHSENTLRTPACSILQNSKICVLTHQILLNTISEKEIDIADFTLLIVDECHNTFKNHPYNEIMKIFSRKKHQSPDLKLPQIVGLTASPGSRKAKNLKQGCDHVMQLLANLHVYLPPVQVRVNKSELSKFTSKGNFTTVPVQRDVTERFAKRIRKVMKKIEREIEDKIACNENVSEDLKFQITSEHGHPLYENQIVGFNEHCKVLKDDTLSQILQICASQLRVYNDALIINEHVREVDALKYIKEKLFPNNESPSLHPHQIKLWDLFQKSELSTLATTKANPLLKALFKIIDEHVASNADSRCIIFARTREIARLLVDCIQCNPDFSGRNLNSTYLTGAGARKSDGGLTKSEQDGLLQKFRAGVFKIMIATSIADEGIDIEACNLVIVYNHNSNEITQIQRKGRARKLESRMYILAYADRDYIKNELDNQVQGEFTQEVLKELNLMDREKFSDRIKELQSNVLKPEEQAEQSSDDSEPQPITELHCVKCRNYVTSSEHFRMVKNHHITIDPEFPSKMKLVRHPPHRLSSEEQLCASIFCGNPECRNKWGGQMIYKGQHINVLGIKHFLLKESGEYKTCKKWKDAFKVTRHFCPDSVNFLSDSEEDASEDLDFDF